MPQIEDKSSRVPNIDPVARPDYTAAEAQAIRALAKGAATDVQQRLASDFIIEVLCGTYDMAYRSNERDTLVALGKQIVGQHLVYLMQRAPIRRSDGEQPT